MKYHYQYVSKTTVRIELIPEDQKETKLLNSLRAENDDQELKLLFQSGLSTYAPQSLIKKITFMNFPSVALCSYEKLAIAEKSTAV